jgi:hypothetical protein
MTGTNNRQQIIRVADADESAPKINFEYIDKKYKEWLIRRGFASEEGIELGMRRSNGRRAKRLSNNEI